MNKEEIQHWQRELERCSSDPGYFFQEYYVVKKIHETDEAIKKDAIHTKEKK